mmetsp:Transcript_39267/g.85510  ORF Transcript_39267/g.85510 Transcript_39267/m.85510 type:complete len:111 (+) Transcript_39267:2349-2681(+)
MIALTLIVWNIVELYFVHKIDKSKIVVMNQDTDIDDQVIQEKRESLGKDYLDLVIESGFIMQFGATNPFIYLIMIFNFQIMLNVDLINVYTKTRRPIPRVDSGIGIFGYF